MGRPSDKDLENRLLEVIPDEGVSRGRVRQDLDWSDTTFEKIIGRLQEEKRIKIGPGGSGGVLYRIRASRKSKGERDPVKFLRALRDATSSDPAKGISNLRLREQLGWSKDYYWKILQALVEEGKIGRKAGRGGVVYLLADGIPDSTRDNQPSKRRPENPANAGAPHVRGPKEEEAPQQQSSAFSREALDNDTKEFLHALRQYEGSRATNNDLQSALDWEDRRYWQTRAELADRGSVHFERGREGLVQAGVSPPRFTEMNRPKLDEYFQKLPRDGEPIAAEKLMGSLGVTDEIFEELTMRLISDTVIQLVSGGAVRLSEKLVASGGQSDPDERALLERLPDGSNPVAIAKISKDLGWSDSKTSSIITNLNGAGYLKFEQDYGTIQRSGKTEKYLDKARKSASVALCRPKREFHDLANLLRSQTKPVYAFVGAGVSMSVKLSSWEALLRQVLIETETGLKPAERGEIEAYINGGALIEAASALASHSSSLFTASIKGALGASPELNYPSLINAIHRLSNRLAAVITTNLDTVLENLLSWPTCTLKAGLDISHKVVKLHGDINDPASWIFTREAYNRLYFGDASYRDRLHALFHNETLLFIGYGMKDLELDMILSWMEGTYREERYPTHYFFIEEGEEGSRPYFMKRLAKLGLHPLVYKGHHTLPLLLTQLAL